MMKGWIKLFIVALVGVAIWYGWPLVSRSSDYLVSDKDRVAEIFGGGTANDGIHTLSQMSITKRDYRLVACANSVAWLKAPHLSYRERSVGRWFAGGSDLTRKEAGYNFHATERLDGSWAIDSFYMTIPKPAYRGSATEIVWFCNRLAELKEKKIPKKRRAEIMTLEWKTKPWLTHKQSK